MKGFIEVIDNYNCTILINLKNLILVWGDGSIETLQHGIINTQYTYDEIKELIKQAQ